MKKNYTRLFWLSWALLMTVIVCGLDLVAANYKTGASLTAEDEAYATDGRLEIYNADDVNRAICLQTFYADKGTNYFDATPNPVDLIAESVAGKPAYSNAYGGMLWFDGNNDYIIEKSAGAFIPRNSMTGRIWAKIPVGATDGSRLFSRDDATGSGDRAFLMSYDDGNSLKVRFGVFVGNAFKSSGRNGVAVNDDTWHHYVGVYDKTNVYLYVDGVLATSTVTTGLIDLDNSARLQIGAYNHASANEPFEGGLDGAMFLDKAWTAAEVAADWNLTKAIKGR